MYPHQLIGDRGVPYFIVVALTSFLIFRFLQLALSIKAREIHFKHGQIKDYVGMAMVQVSYRYIFYWFAIDTG